MNFFDIFAILFMVAFFGGAFFVLGLLFKKGIIKIGNPYTKITKTEKKLRIIQAIVIAIMFIVMTVTMLVGFNMRDNFKMLPIPLLISFVIMIICGVIFSVVTVTVEKMKSYRHIEYVEKCFEEKDNKTKE